jgi:hypothetical protein
MTRIQKSYFRQKEFFPSFCIICYFFLPALAFLPFLSRSSCKANNFRPSASPLLYFSESRDTETTTLATTKVRYEKTVKNIRRRTFAEMYPRLVQFQKQHGHTHVTTEYDEELEAWTKNLRYNCLWQVRGFPDPSGKRKKISAKKLQLLKNVGFSWETKRDWQRWPCVLSELKEYQRKYGTTHVDPAIDQDLYDWTKNIRANYRHQALNQTTAADRRPRLASSKLEALNNMGFDWNTSEQRQDYLRWKDMMPRLQTFQAKHGHTRVPKDYKDYNLYRWTQNIKMNYGHQLTNTTSSTSRKGRTFRHFLSPRRLQQLQEVGFDWEQRSTMWERSFQELREYWKEHGHCHVTTLENRQLTGFCHRQRQEFRKLLGGNATSLTPERMEALRSINFDWARTHDKLWMERCAELKAYVEHTGSADVPQTYAANYQLGRWIMNQRIRYRRRQEGFQNGMTRERVRELEKLGFQWSIPEMRWKSMYNRLKTYQEANGHLEIPTTDMANSDLRQWINAQRHFYRTKNYSRLTEERVRLMESIPDFEWRRQLRSGPSKNDWSELFVAIREKGIAPGAKVRQHWFDGLDRWADVKTEYTEKELLALWNEEEDEDDVDEFFEEDEDEESDMFVT